MPHLFALSLSPAQTRTAATTLLLAALTSSSAASATSAFAAPPTPSPAAHSAVVPPVQAPKTLPVVAASTGMRIQVPHSQVLRGHPAAVWVRLFSGNQGVPSAPLTLQRWGNSGWATVAHMTTGDAGLTHVTLVFPATTRVRAVYDGALLRRPSASPVAQVQIVAPPRPRPAAPSLGQQAVAEAARHAGAPYVWGAAGPDSFDCSGLTMYVFGRFGRSLPHNASAQSQVTMPVAPGAQQPGDLIFFSPGGSISHVGIYAGNGQVWNAPHSGSVVSLEPMSYFGPYSVGRVR